MTAESFFSNPNEILRFVTAKRIQIRHHLICAMLHKSGGEATLRSVMEKLLTIVCSMLCFPGKNTDDLFR